MKVGLYAIEVPASVGGGFVLREDLAKAAATFADRHAFETVMMPAWPPLHTRVKIRVNRLVGRSAYTKTSVARWMSRQAAARKLDVLWFNHFEPIHIGIPYILSIFDLQHRLQPGFPEVSAGREWDHREQMWANATRRAAMVTVGSQEAKEQLCHFYGVPPENVFVLPFPTPQKAIDLAENPAGAPADADMRAKYGIQGEFLFYPAQFWPHKNHVNLLHALRLLDEKHGRRLSLVFTGSDHGNREHVERVAAQLGLKDRVHFCGFVPYADILAFYRQARALSYTSFFGPENLPPLEAMALGCPVLLSDIPGVRTLHGEGPVYADPRQPEAIAAGIARLLADPEQTQARVRAGRAVALANDCRLYIERFQLMLDEYAPVRRCWP